ncbi:hypothetical protein CDD83_8659 [Cordyceps sp. RAO-2017]|nr:hypothetical protein CDD83_8659 [Cordyceps sp. RAO-2017]
MKTSGLLALVAAMACAVTAAPLERRGKSLSDLDPTGGLLQSGIDMIGKVGGDALGAVVDPLSKLGKGA